MARSARCSRSSIPTTAAPTRPPPRACGCCRRSRAARRGRPRSAPGLEALQRARARHRAGARRGAAVLLGRAGLARHRRLRRDRRRHPGAGGHRHDQARRCRRPRHRHARSRAAARRADAAGVRISPRCSTRIAAPPRKAARISPTTPRSPNGPGIKVATFRGRKRQREADHRRGFRHAPRRGGSQASPICASAPASTCMPSATAIMSGSAASHSARPRADRPFGRRRRAACAGRRDPRRARRRRHRQAFSAERSALARRLVRPVPEIRGRARAASAAAGSRISISPSCARRRASVRIATRCASASPRSPSIVDRPRRRQGDHQREARLHRPREGIVAHGDRHGPPALVLVMDRRWPIARPTLPRPPCSICARRRSSRSRRRSPAPAAWSPAR